MLKALRATQLKSSSMAEGQPEKNHWSKEILPPSSQDCNPFDSSMWCEFEREVSKKPHNTLASLRAKDLGGNGQHGQGVCHSLLQEVLV